MLTAIINQETCVKCTLCIVACPFDAIIGSIGQKHTVLLEACVGCKLCVNPCPVDCIEMVSLTSIEEGKLLDPKQVVRNAKERRALKIERNKSPEIAKFPTQETIHKELTEILAKKTKIEQGE